MGVVVAVNPQGSETGWILSHRASVGASKSLFGVVVKGCVRLQPQGGVGAAAKDAGAGKRVRMNRRQSCTVERGMGAKQLRGVKSVGTTAAPTDAARRPERIGPIRFANDDGRRLKGPRRLFLPSAIGLNGPGRPPA
jgi:hypothetical protein